jgi:23S rRNA (adenine2503-C2)-methyltransferase
VHRRERSPENGRTLPLEGSRPLPHRPRHRVLPRVRSEHRGRVAPAVSGSRADIASLDRAALAGFLAEAGQPAYRLSQLVSWLYGRGATSFGDMTDLPSALRERLDATFFIGALEQAERLDSSDGTRKYLWPLTDGAAVEGVGLPAGDRLTVCFSTQVGCAMACGFCATGRGGFVRDLSPGEMVRQVAAVAADFGRRVTNAVAMGQGEPFANYDATLAALRFLNAPEAVGIGARHLTVSTSGVLPGIRRFSTEPEQFTLAVSLHSAVQPTRDRLMPGLRRWPVVDLRRELAAYVAIGGRRVTLEYALIDGVNDTPGELAALLHFCRGLLCHVNLIPMNAVGDSRFRRSPDQRVRAFRSALTEADVETSVRIERGADIHAACGQLKQRDEADR